MRKGSDFLIYFSLLTFFSCSGIKNEGPQLFFEKSAVDFGLVNPGQTLEFVFDFSNKGTDTLKIQDIKASCGCIILSSAKQKIPANGMDVIKGQIKVKDSMNIANNIQTIAIRTNESGDKIHLLKISYKVKM